MCTKWTLHLLKRLFLQWLNQASWKCSLGKKRCKMFANNASTATTVLLAVLKQHIENLTGQQEPYIDQIQTSLQQFPDLKSIIQHKKQCCVQTGDFCSTCCFVRVLLDCWISLLDWMCVGAVKTCNPAEESGFRKVLNMSFQRISCLSELIWIITCLINACIQQGQSCSPRVSLLKKKLWPWCDFLMKEGQSTILRLPF